MCCQRKMNFQNMKKSSDGRKIEKVRANSTENVIMKEKMQEK